jgi:hypothetical protein
MIVSALKSDILFPMISICLGTTVLIDEPVFDCGALQGKSLAMKAYREASKQYIKHQLLPENPCPDLTVYPLELQKAIECWEEVGVHIRSVCNQGTCLL